jgi:hypothetical protein
MKAWSAALARDVADWPQVTARSFFGLTALYRRERIFALLPRTRAMETPNSIALKLETLSPRVLARLQSDPRFRLTQMHKGRWFTFELTETTDLRDAMDWLGQAHKTGKTRTPD